MGVEIISVSSIFNIGRKGLRRPYTASAFALRAIDISRQRLQQELLPGLSAQVTAAFNQLYLAQAATIKAKGLSTRARLMEFFHNPAVNRDSERSLTPGAVRTIDAAITAETPIRVVLPSFPRKAACPIVSRFDTPDLAEAAAIFYFSAAHKMLSSFYSPGLEIYLLSWGGRRFADGSFTNNESVMRYQRELQNLIDICGCQNFLKVIDFEPVIQRCIPEVRLQSRESLYTERCKYWFDAFSKQPTPESIDDLLANCSRVSANIEHLDAGRQRQGSASHISSIAAHILSTVRFTFDNGADYSLFLHSVLVQPKLVSLAARREFFHRVLRSTAQYLARIESDAASLSHVVEEIYSNTLRGSIHLGRGDFTVAMMPDYASNSSPWCQTAALIKNRFHFDWASRFESKSLSPMYCCKGEISDGSRFMGYIEDS
jgi:pyoverdine/dityrosine biosynthesis protein Dit1